MRVRKPETSLVFVGTFLTAWGSAASVTADGWAWRVIDVVCAMTGAWALKRFADQVLAWMTVREDA